MRHPLDTPALRDSCKRLVRALDTALASGPLSRQEVTKLIREAAAAFVLLRWLDQVEAEKEAMAAFEDRSYRPLLPPELQWRHWRSLETSAASLERLQLLVDHLERRGNEPTHSGAPWLQRLAAPLRRLLKIDPLHWLDLLRWVGEPPFETPSDRRGLLKLLDVILEETREASDEGHQTPTNVARLVAALAQPQPGERVYDPCFGLGNFLISAWQHAEKTQQRTRRPGYLLEVAGIEINEQAFLVGLTRILLAGIDHPQLELGNSLERGQPNSPSRDGFDLVLANPPIGAKVSHNRWGIQHFAFHTADSVGLFVQHALAQLKPQGRAVIAVPEGFLFRGGAERELRRHLLERGLVEAVVGLPAGSFAPYAGVKGALLLLRRAGGADRVRMLDAAPLFDASPKVGRGRGAPVIRTEVIAQLADDLRRPELRTPVKGFEDPTPDRGLISRLLWEVPVRDLASSDWDLTPRRREEGGLLQLLARLRAAFGDDVAEKRLRNVAQVMAGRAIKAVDLIDSDVDDRQQADRTGYVRIKDLRQGKVGRLTTWVRPEVAVSEQAWALVAGDVLLSKSGTIGKTAVVRNEAIGALASKGLYVVRPDQEYLDPAFLMAYLANPICQSWLAARTRGSVIQHLNKSVLDELPVPVPPLHVQAQVAAQFRDHGTDVLTALLQLSPGGEAERLITWLAELNEKLPAFAAGVDATPSPSQLEPLVDIVKRARNQLVHSDVDASGTRLILALNHALQPLSGLSQVPPGPGLLTVLQNAERGLQLAPNELSDRLPVESQAREVVARLRGWLRALIDDLVSGVELRVTQLPEMLPAGHSIEFTVKVNNAGVLPVRDLLLRTSPDWGSVASSYLAEGFETTLTLSGETPKRGERLSVELQWQARTLVGSAVSGVIQLAIPIASPATATEYSARKELGGNPYVTGSPLEPKNGHAVFYGREKLIAQIRNQIVSHGNVVLLEGNRRAGKTSILRHLEGLEAIPGWLAVYASLQAAEGAAQAAGVPTAEVYRLIAFELSKGIAKLELATPLPDGSAVSREALLGEDKIAKLQEAGRIRKACRSGISADSPFSDFRDYLEICLQLADSQGLGIVLMLDEFDKLQEGIDNGVTSAQVPENIRFLIQSYSNFSAILTGSRRLKRLREEHWSALYGLGTSMLVTALDMDNARRVVTEPVRGRLTYSDEAIERVIELTARQPYLIQCLCNRIFDFVSQAKGRSVTLSIVEDAAAALVRDNEHFASLWDYSAQGPITGGFRRQLILLQCALALKRGVHLSFGALGEQLAQLGAEVEEADLDADLTYLRELDLVAFSGEIGDGQYALAIPLMAQWIEQQQDADVVTSRARAEAEDEHA